MGDSFHQPRRQKRRHAHASGPPTTAASSHASTALGGNEFENVDRAMPGTSQSQPAKDLGIQSAAVSAVDVFAKELQCPVCFGLMDEPYATICAHSFCRRCLERSLQLKKRCPRCNYPLDKPDQIFPNETLLNLVRRCSEKQTQMKRMRVEVPSCGGELLVSIIKCLSDPAVDFSAISRGISLLQQKIVQLEQNDKTLRSKLLKEFLEEMIARRSEKVEKLNREVNLLEQDLKYMHSNVSNLEPSVVPSPTEGACQQFDVEGNCGSADVPPGYGNANSITFASPSTAEAASTLLNRRRRIRTHFDDLELYYLNSRFSHDLPEPSTSSGNAGEHMDRLGECLTKLTQYSGLNQRATLNYTVDLHSGMNIVSSIEFDRDGEYFAIAGVTRKIKLYDYNTILNDSVDIHYPISEMQCGSKISCVSWNPYNKAILASSDYEGIVQLWDVVMNRSVKKFKEHEKRCWSVCFNQVDTKMMASGSDDAKVKLWSLDVDHSILTLEAKVNVCCVQFHPGSRYHIAFGSADHCVHYYDLRSPKQPVMLCRGHKKAVSYVKFLNHREFVSASTDSQLRLWSADTGQCIRVMKGHHNEKNFVGLATDGDYIACGSETDNLVVYYKELSKPILTHSFGREIMNSLDRVDPESGADFVSAVCWKENTNVILAANSQGIIKVLELE